MKKLISLMVILPLLTTTINNPHAAAAETDSTSYRIVNTPVISSLNFF